MIIKFRSEEDFFSREEVTTMNHLSNREVLYSAELGDRNGEVAVQMLVFLVYSGAQS